MIRERFLTRKRLMRRYLVERMDGEDSTKIERTERLTATGTQNSSGRSWYCDGKKERIKKNVFSLATKHVFLSVLLPMMLLLLLLLIMLLLQLQLLLMLLLQLRDLSQCFCLINQDEKRKVDY